MLKLSTLVERDIPPICKWTMWMIYQSNIGIHNWIGQKKMKVPHQKARRRGQISPLMSHRKSLAETNETKSFQRNKLPRFQSKNICLKTLISINVREVLVENLLNWFLSVHCIEHNNLCCLSNTGLNNMILSISQSRLNCTKENTSKASLCIWDMKPVIIWQCQLPAIRGQWSQGRPFWKDKTLIVDCNQAKLHHSSGTLSKINN